MSTRLTVDPAVLSNPVAADHVQFMPFRDRTNSMFLLSSSIVKPVQL